MNRILARLTAVTVTILGLGAMTYGFLNMSTEFGIGMVVFASGLLSYVAFSGPRISEEQTLAQPVPQMKSAA